MEELYAKFVFSTKKDALAFKKADFNGHTTAVKLCDAVNEQVPCTLDTNEDEKFLVDIDKTKTNPVRKDGDFWYIELVEYIEQPKKKVAVN